MGLEDDGLEAEFQRDFSELYHAVTFDPDKYGPEVRRLVNAACSFLDYFQVELLEDEHHD